jgi:hypothetical protein
MIKIKIMKRDERRSARMEPTQRSGDGALGLNARFSQLEPQADRNVCETAASKGCATGQWQRGTRTEPDIRGMARRAIPCPPRSAAAPWVAGKPLASGQIREDLRV